MVQLQKLEQRLVLQLEQGRLLAQLWLVTQKVLEELLSFLCLVGLPSSPMLALKLAQRLSLEALFPS